MTYQPSLGTHFNAQVDRETLTAIRAFGFRWARMDCQTCSIETMLAMIQDAVACGLTPLPIVADSQHLDALYDAPLALDDVEWGNEPDGDVPPSVYRTSLDAACVMAEALGVRLWAPALSNLDRNSLFWLERVRGSGWPAGMAGVSVHRYGDGTFEWAHDGYADRDAEVEHLLRLCDGLPFLVTEFGYPTDPVPRARIGKRERFLRVGLQLTEQQAAANITREWDFWRAYTEVPILYQINDGPNPGETYGIRRCLPDGTLTDWKRAAYTVPQEELPMPDDTGIATFCLSRASSFPSSGRPGAFHTYYPKGQTETVLSIQPDGRKETRPASAAGAWETWVPSKDGNRAVFDQTIESYALPLVD